MVVSLPLASSPYCTAAERLYTILTGRDYANSEDVIESFLSWLICQPIRTMTAQFICLAATMIWVGVVLVNRSQVDQARFRLEATVQQADS